MPRQNTPHVYESLVALAGQFKAVHDSIVVEANRFKTHKVKGSISLAHQSKIEDGLLAGSRFVRELRLKLDNLIEERGRS